MWDNPIHHLYNKGGSGETLCIYKCCGLTGQLSLYYLVLVYNGNGIYSSERFYLS